MTQKRKPATVFHSVLRILIEGRARQAACYAAGPLRALDDTDLTRIGLSRAQINSPQAYEIMLG